METKALFSAASDNWKTPQKTYDGLNKEFMFDYDPCPLNSKDKHALLIDWEGTSVFCNPPYSNISNFMDKALLELKKGRVKQVVFLVPSRTDTKWWHTYVLPNAKEIRFIKGRLRFGEAKNSAPFPSAIIVFKG